MYEKVMFFIDGENLVFRYQSMLGQGRKPLNGIKHEKNVYVWHTDIIKNKPRNIVRVTYYTSATGAVEKIRSFSEDIKKIVYHYQGPPYGSGGSTHHQKGEGRIFPRVFKKENREAKSKAVDINIAVDMLNYASLENLDAVYLLSGDGDFIPLIQAVMAKGKRVYLMALSDGLKPELPLCADDYICIDDRLFAEINKK